MNNKDISSLPEWLSGIGDGFLKMIEQGRFPHALLIHGPRGTGKRLLALWTATRLLKIASANLAAAVGPGRVIDAETVPPNPDLRLFQLEEDARDLKIETIRDMIAFIQLTSHGDGMKVALVCPAEAMNRNAENSLLKTLEEPPARSAIILVADAISRLEPTVISRCHRERIAMPSREAAMQWLDSLDAGRDWNPALDLAGGAPVGALQLEDSGFGEQAAEFEQDIDRLLARSATPVEVAKRWARKDNEICLRWLYQRICAEMRTSHLQTNAEMLSMERSYGHLREINQLRRLQGGGLNAETQLGSLLTRWYGGAGIEN